MKLVTSLFVLLCSMLLGCETISYSYGVKKFNNPDDALAYQRSQYVEITSLVSPLSSPITKKKVLISIPNKESIVDDLIIRQRQADGKEINATRLKQIDYIAESIKYKYSNFAECISRSNIFTQVDVVNSSYISIPAATVDMDVLCFFSTGSGTPVIYYINVKNGKQVFTFDTSFPSGKQRIDALLDSVKSFALQ